MQQSDSRGRPRSDSEPRSSIAKKPRSESEPRVTQKKKVTRDSSVGSGREVRCGCQYFQSDSLLPERVTLVGRPPSRTSLGRVANMATAMGDHEYEPINPRPQTPAESPALRNKMATDMEVDEPSSPIKKPESETSSIGSGDRNFVRISLHDENDVKVQGMEDGEVQLSPQEMQTRMEERYFAATPTTTESRTDCDVNTSQLDSSGLEDLPLRRGSRKKKGEEGGEPNTRGFQQRIRSQAGRIRAKLRSMKMPERPKFNLPDRPKFNMPERPKFNMPERPKFNLPDRPKFNFPERPKFNMPNMPSFSRTKTAKTTSSTRRPLRDRATNPSTESNASSSRKNFFDFDFKTYPRIFDRSSRRKGEYATSSPRSTPRSQTPPPSMESTKQPKMPFRKKGPVGSRWINRFSDIKYVDDEENKEEESRYRRERDSPDVRVIRLRDSTDDEREDLEEQERRERDEREEIEYALQRNQVRAAVEEMERQRDSVQTEPTTPFEDKDYGYAVTVVENKTDAKEDSVAYSDREQRSSGSSSDRHRAGVLEEIDSDEFFLREKGISHEDVDVGRYLTNEIRDAFRSPENALTKVDDKYYYDDDEEDNLGGQYRGTPEREPLPPVRTRSLKPRKRASKAPITKEEDTTHFYKTFPPARPTRNRRYQQEGSGADISKDDENIEEEEEPAEAPTFLVTDHSEVSYETQEDDYRNKMDDEHWQDIEPIVVSNPPTAPRRVRRSRVEQAPESSFKEHVRETKEHASESSFKEQIPEALRNGHHTHNGWGDDKETNMVQQEVFALNMEPDYIIPGVNEPDSPPVAPRRDRRKSSRGASLHSLADEDRTSREADSLPSERDQENQSYKEEARIGTVQLNEADLGETGGYATVEKIYPTKPARPNRPKPPPRPPAPARRKRLSHFFSLPRKNTHAPPTRPLRNYSTLGPSRPARRERTRQIESTTALEDDYNRSGQEDLHGSNRDLSSGAVIRKMKGRPLPAPPRPPRKTKDQEGGEVEEEIFDTIDEPEIGSALGALNDSVFYTQRESGSPVNFTSTKNDDRLKESNEKSSGGDKEAFLVSGDVEVESEYVEEVSIATQTDPLPEDFCMDVEEDEPRPHSDACTETIDTETTIPYTSDGRSETNSSSDVTQIAKEEAINLGWMPEFSPPSMMTPVASTPNVAPVNEPPAPKQVTVPVLESSPAPPVTVPVLESPLPPVKVSVLESPPPVTALVLESVPPPPVAPVLEPVPPPPPTIIERQVPVYILPDQDTVIELKAERLQVSELDVGKLNVGELSAQRILVSDIDGVSMQVAELSSKSGQLVVNGIELPPGFLQELYDSLPRLRAATPQPEPSVPSSPPPATPQTVPEATPPSIPVAPAPVPEPTPPSVPPLPIHIPISPMYSFIPSAMRVPRSSVQDMDSEEEMISFIPATPRRRRHQHHASKPVSSRYSSDEEEEVVSFQPRRQGVRGDGSGGEPSVGELGRQLVSAVQTSSMRAMRSLLQYTATQLEGEDKRRELQTALCILLILVAGLILLGFGTGKTSHHHHWDYFNPPNN